MPRLQSLGLLALLAFAAPQLPHDPPRPLIPPFKLTAPSQPPPSDNLHDNSDWFSVLRPTGNDGELSGEVDGPPIQERQIPPSNFQIPGIDFASDSFTAVEHKFGQIHEMRRGDASAGRDQACYVSATGENKIHLIFEQGEIDSTVYLFTGGPDWYGRDRCIATKLVSTRVATASGLRLGLTPSQVIAILGKPSRCQVPVPFTVETRAQSPPNPTPYPCNSHPRSGSAEIELLYSFHATKTLTARERADFLRKNPTLTAQDVDERFSTFDWGAAIDARFTNSRLTFLSLSVAETD